MTSFDANLPGSGGPGPRRVLRSGTTADASLLGVPSSSALTELVDRSVAGEERALTELLRLLQPLVVRYCRSRVGEYERAHISADDIAQDVCLAVLRALPTYQDQGRPFLAFVYGIAQHKVVDGHRSAYRDRSIPFATLPDSRLEADFESEPWPSTQLGGELGVDLREDESTLSDLLANLPPLEREVLRLSVVAGLGPERAAEALGITPAEASAVQGAALDELRNRLDELQEERDLLAIRARNWGRAPISGFEDLDDLLRAADANLQRLQPESERGPSIYGPRPAGTSLPAEESPAREPTGGPTASDSRGQPGRRSPRRSRGRGFERRFTIPFDGDVASAIAQGESAAMNNIVYPRAEIEAQAELASLTEELRNAAQSTAVIAALQLAEILREALDAYDVERIRYAWNRLEETLGELRVQANLAQISQFVHSRLP